MQPGWVETNNMTTIDISHYIISPWQCMYNDMVMADVLTFENKLFSYMHQDSHRIMFIMTIR